jgi:hypothetical protein
MSATATRPTKAPKATPQGHGRHHLARRLLRLPHVVPRHGRAPGGPGRSDRHRLQPAGGHQELPEQVDVGILEGSISNEEDLHKAKEFRKRCKLLISLGDCAVNGNVPAMRNPFKLDDVIDRAYRDNVDLNPQIPTEGVPRCCPGASPSTASSMWMSSCPAARRMPIPSTTS